MSPARAKAYRLVAIPIAIVGFLSLLLLILQGFKTSYSFLLGGGIWAIPNLYFAYKVLTDNIVQSPKRLAQLFYRAEIIKLLLSGVLFVGVIKFLPVSTLAVLSAYLVAQLVFWLAIWCYLGIQTK